MEPKLFQSQSQKMILSPQLRQYLKVLQMPLAELLQSIETEIAENPMLEDSTAEKIEDNPDSPEIDTASQLEASKDTREIEINDSFDNINQADENFWDSYEYRDPSAQDPSSLQKKKDYQESLLTKPEALSDFLLWQVNFLNFSDSDRLIAEEIIGNINDDGYLLTPLEEIAQSCQCPPEKVEQVLAQIQQFDPPGIGARNLQEALCLQLKRKGTEASLALEIVSHHLHLLEKRDWPHLAKILAADIPTIKKAGEIISHLEPKPGRTFFSDTPIAVVPDATVSFSNDEAEKFKIEIHDEKIPELRINPYYRHLLRKKNLDVKSKVFLKEKLQNALNFMRALKLRKSTLEEITDAIVKAQTPFFEKGFSHLHPLRLKDIANTIGIHESTVSRALQGKYISTPQGTIPYKSFFSTKLETTSGGPESQKSILEKIKNLVEKESPENPLSDQEIVGILKSEGLKIARRTISKYREILRILPSHMRRKK